MVPTRRSLGALALAASLVVCGCAGRRVMPTVGGSFAVSSDYEAELSIAGASETVDSKYRSGELVLGATFYDGDDRKFLRPELRVGASRHGDRDGFPEVDAFEFGSGLRWYPYGGRVAPYVSLLVLTTVLDDIEGVDLGAQLGLRLGAGIEFDITRNFFLDVGADYLVPLIAAESDLLLVDTGGGVVFLDRLETELSGFALRIGAGFRF